MKVVIVGGVAGGASAAARLRRLDESAEIVMFERSGYVSYANCGLPYYIGCVITDPAQLTLQTPESFKRRFNIDVRVRHEVTAIDIQAKTVSVTNLETGESFKEPYDKLLLSPGAKPTIPPLAGVDLERVFSLRTVEDTFAIHEFVRQNNPKTVVIAGGGFIGLEMAENLLEMGIQVTIVQRPTQVMSPLDADMAAQLHVMLREHGALLRLGRTVEGFELAGPGGCFAVPSPNDAECASCDVASGCRVRTLLKDEEPLESDFVIMAIGVTPDSSLAKAAGLELGQKGSIVVSDRMETSAADVYAVGDAVEVTQFVSGLRTVIPLAGPANKQGRIAADNMCGIDSRYQGSQGSSVLKLFDLAAAVTGLNEKMAKAAGITYDKVVLSPNSHASYYPGAKSMVMKVLYEKGTLRLLGAQIVGREGVDKRIDVLATAIRCEMAATELAELDLAYAPPYSSAKDPVNMAGFMIENLESGLVRQYHWHDVADLPRDGSVTLLDTRTPKEYARGHADGFVNIPVDELRDRLDELDAAKPVYVMCQSGIRSYIACRILAGHGFEAFNFSGGYGFYASVTQELAREDSTYPCGMVR